MQEYDMPSDFNIANTGSNNDATRNCSASMGVSQLALGILLITASAFGYSLTHHSALLIPAMMGATLLFYGAKAALVCRYRPQIGDRQHPSNGAMS
jgi:hypothetical protein